MAVATSSTPLPPTESSATKPPSSQGNRAYRILFYLAALVAVVMTALAWQWKNRPSPIDLTAFALERDKNYSFIVDAYGYKYQGQTGNVIDEYALRYGAWEKDRLFFVRDYLKNLALPDAVAIDVGANTGHHALFYSRHAARVLAFEPFPPVIAKFKQNLALNPHITNVELCEVGLGDQDAELPFAAPDEVNHGQGSFRTELPQQPGMTSYEKKLRIVVGDDYLKDKNLGPVAYVKIDVEGYEEPALKGLRRLIEKHRPMLQLEVSPQPNGTIRSFDHLKSLFPENYEFFVLLWTVEGLVKGEYHLIKLDPATINKDGQLELIACPSERLPILPGR